ncbi:MAG: radical SAM protein [Candidatus Woesearchaeota archaeon]
MKVQIEVTNVCNLKCKMCPRNDFHKLEIKHMPFGLFKRVVSRLSPSYKLVLTGWGEPFCHPKIYEMIKFCKKRGNEVSLTTNGLLLKPEKVIESGLDKITFSIDSLGEGRMGHEISAAAKIKEFVEFKRRAKAKKPKITLQTVLIKKEDVIAVAHFAKELGIHKLNLTKLDERIGTVRNMRDEELKSLIKILNKIKIRFDLVQYAVGPRGVRLAYKIIRPILLKGRCLRTYNYAYINVSGEVTPCCNLPRFRLGSILKDDLKKLLKGKDYKIFLRNSYKLCKGCNVFR